MQLQFSRNSRKRKQYNLKQTFTALEAAQHEVTLEDLWKGSKTVLLEVARETIGCVKSLMRLSQQSGKKGSKQQR